jgi:regulator of RNase E activity RraB
MLWGKEIQYHEAPFEVESEIEDAIVEVSPVLFGSNRIYLEVKKKIGAKGKTKNIPDGYLIDLASSKDPRLYVVENELAKHDPLKHIAIQILEFSLSFETSPFKVKSIVKGAMVTNNSALSMCQAYATKNGYENIDVLLERMVYGEDRFNAMVIIDELSDELEKTLISRFQFPVEILTIERYKDEKGKFLFKFVPFLSDIAISGEAKNGKPIYSPIDPSDIDTIVVPARDEGFEEVFLGENRWWAIRIHSSMLPKIRYIAAYRVAPKSAITHIAPVASIEQWKDTSKYVVNFTQPAEKIGPIELVPKGLAKALQNSRYTSKARIDSAKTLDDAF